MKVPEATSSAQTRSYSVSDPSHQTIRSGFARPAISDTHWRRPRWRTHAGAFDWSAGAAAGAFIRIDSRSQTAQREAGPTHGNNRSAILSSGSLREAAAQPSFSTKVLRKHRFNDSRDALAPRGRRETPAPWSRSP